VTVDLTFSPPLDRTATSSSMDAGDFLRSPTVQQKLALATSAGKGKSKLGSSSASGPLPARADISVVRSRPSPSVLQADSHFLTRESGNSPRATEEQQEAPSVRSASRAVLSGGVLPAPLETHVADTQTEWVVYFPVTLIPEKRQRKERMGLDLIRLLRMYT
jgi:hypothetical protein